jgi:hemerythrin-like domain-containing protein
VNDEIVGELAREHEELRALLQPIQQAAEARDAAALALALEAGRGGLGASLDSHITKEEASVFATAEESLGVGVVGPFRSEHRMIEALRDVVLGWSGATDPPYAQSLELCERMLEHQQREDIMLFPAVRGALATSAPRP